jgi:hypothetical protein
MLYQDTRDLNRCDVSHKLIEVQRRDMSLLTELEIVGSPSFYKHNAPNGALESGIQRNPKSIRANDLPSIIPDFTIAVFMQQKRKDRQSF